MKVFLDTNVFLYAFLNQDASKKAIAVGVISDAIENDNGYISLQVAKEFCNVMLKRSQRTAVEIAKAAQLFARFHLVCDSLDLVRSAVMLKEQHGIQFYDFLMVAAAADVGCQQLITEDLNDGQLYSGVRVVNPFKKG